MPKRHTEVRGGLPAQREEQVPRIELMPDGDTAGARGAALEAARVFRSVIG